jgi:hypothetical protein
MRARNATFAHAALGTALLLLAACGSQPDAAFHQQDTVEVDAKPASLTQVKSASIDLPADEETFGEGPHADVLNRNCLACHSTSMVRYQPPLTRKQWTATVDKMREAYAAPFEKAQTGAIVDALVATQPPSRSAIAQPPISSRPISMRRISLVPAPMSSSLASRKKRSTGQSLV